MTRPRHQLRGLVWVIALAAVCVVGAIWFVRLCSSGCQTFGAYADRPPPYYVTYGGFQREPTFSPDGNQVAFVWDGDKQDNPDIYVKLIGTTGPPLRLTTDASDFSPAWSPDGRFIAFLRDLSGQKSAVLLIPALGCPERKITEINNAAPDLPGPYLAWSPEGNSLVISERDSPTGPLAGSR